MTTKQIIDQMEKEFDEKFWHEEALETHQPCEYLLNNEDGKCNCQIKDIKKFIHSYTRTLLESFGEEIIGRDRDEVIGNETYINTIIENQLRAEQRLKVKEIISSIGK